MSIIAAEQAVWNKEPNNMAMANLLDMTDRKSADKQKALDSALAQIERQFGKGSIMKLGADNPVAGDRIDIHRVARARHRAGHRRSAEGPDRRNLRARKLRQDDADAALHRRRAEKGRRLRLCRCRTCA
jgi:hypothetical protein